jgi:hypothetical protein
MRYTPLGAVARHGFLPVMRTLSRRERAAAPVAAF